MGKRELVLILAFIVAGAIVYEVTAPPLRPGQQGLSFGRVAQQIRQSVHGRPAHASAQSTRTDAVDASTAEVRINVALADLKVVGEDRGDVMSQFTVDSDGVDDQEAQRLAKAAVLRSERSGSGLVLQVDYPSEGRQRGSLAIRVPKRLAVRINNDNRSGNIDVQHVAAVEVRGSRGTATVTDVDGDVTLTHRGSTPLNIARTGSVRLTAISGDAHVSDVRGPASIEATGSNVELANVRGPVDVKARNADVRLRSIAELQAPLRCDLQSGRLDIDGLQTEARIDGRDTEMRISVARAVPITVTNSSDDITIVAPPDGYTLDAVATDGAVSIADGEHAGVAVAKAAGDREQRATGPMHGGGPTITVRNRNGDISIRASAGR